MKATLTVLGLAALTTSGLAQWSSSAAAPNLIGDRPNDQIQPKIKSAADGSTYIAWLDNATGGYDVYLQRLDSHGNELWAHNGLLVADRGVSSTQDYDLDVDADGNAVLSFNDDRFGNAICVSKVSPTGTLAWGSAGRQIPAVGFLGFPHVAILDDGNYAVGYTEDNSYVWAVLNSAGVIQNTQSYSETGKPYFFSDIFPSTNGTFIVLYVRRFNSTFSSAKALWAQKYDASGTALWNDDSPIPVYAPTGAPYPSQGGSIQNGAFPEMISDQAGGAVFAWNEIGGPRNALVQRITSNGTTLFPVHGATNASTSNAWIRTSCSAAYDAASDTVYSASVETNASNQSQFRVFVQKHDSTGAMQWGSNGIDVIALNGNQPSIVQCVPTGDGVAVFGFDARSILTGVVFSAGVSSSGNLLWSSFAHSVDSGKGRLAVTRNPLGHSLLTWHTGSPTDVAAARVNDFGGLGNPPEAAPESIIIVQGEEFLGDLSSLGTSDDDRFLIFPDSTSLTGEIEAAFTLPAGEFGTLWLVGESSAERFGLAVSYRAKNIVSNTWTTVGGTTETGADTMRSYPLNPSLHLSGERQVKIRLSWSPINDEDPSQDGWTLSLDLLRVEGR